jgi:hypothetical protein
MSRPASALFLFVIIAAGAAACSGGVVDVGATDANKQQLKKKTDGGASGDGTTCSFDDVAWYDAQTGQSGTSPGSGTRYNVGDKFPSPDGCNTCSCTAQGIACTEMACASDGGPAPGCDYNGHHYNAGDKRIPASDGCNTCDCGANGEVACTDLGCVYQCPPEKTIDCMPMVPPENQAKCSGPYHDWIVKNCPGVVFAL